MSGKIQERLYARELDRVSRHGNAWMALDVIRNFRVKEWCGLAPLSGLYWFCNVDPLARLAVHMPPRLNNPGHRILLWRTRQTPRFLGRAPSED